MSQLDHLLRQRWSLVVVDHIAAAWSYALLSRNRHRIERVVYCTHNEEFKTRLSIVTSEPVKAPLHLLDAWRARLTDARMFSIADAVTCISSNDIAAYRSCRFARQTPLHLLLPVYTGVTCQRRIISPETPRTVCLVGSFIWSAKKRNLLSFLQTCSALFAEHSIQIKVIGNMRKEFRATLQQRWPQVCFTGPVNDITEHLDDVRLAVIPEQAGGGFKMKSLECVFQRLPLFALDHALVDLPLKHSYSVQLFPDLKSLVGGVIRNIDDVALLNSMQHRAFDACGEFLNPGTMVRQLQEVVHADRV